MPSENLSVSSVGGGIAIPFAGGDDDTSSACAKTCATIATASKKLDQAAVRAGLARKCASVPALPFYVVKFIRG